MTPTSPDVQIAGMLNPRTVVMVGASARESRIGGMIPMTLRRFGFAGTVIPVNPNHATICDYAAVPSVADVPANADSDQAVVFVNRPAAETVDHVSTLAEAGYRSFVILASGFAELDADGASLQQRLREDADRHGLVVVGPNCPGLANFASGFVAFGTTNFRRLATFRPGGIAIISASGGLGNTIFSYLQQRRLGASALIGVGNEAVTTATDLIHYFADDPSCDTVVAYLEQIRDVPGFEAGVARLRDRGKQLIMIKAGRRAAGASLLRSHTGALAGSGEIARDLLSDLGVIVVDDPEELADVALLRHAGVSGTRQGILSLPGGGKAILADAAEEQGLTVPPLSCELTARLRDLVPNLAAVENPLDPSAELSSPTAIADVLEVMGDSGEFDSLVFFPLNSDPELATGIAEGVAQRYTEQKLPTQVVVIWTATTVLEDNAWRVIRDAHIPLFTNIGQAFRAMARVRSADRPVGVQTRPSPPAGEPGHLERGLTDDVIACLGSRGFPVPRRAMVAWSEPTGATWAGSWPVVVKADHCALPHRAKVGGVRLGIASDDALRTAMAEVRADVARLGGLEIDTFEVQEQQPPGIEWIVSTSCDPEFGRVVTVGIGGVFVEALRDAVHARPSADQTLLRERIMRTRVGPALAAMGGDGSRLDGLVAVCARMSELAAELEACGATGTLELNPVIVSPDTGATVVVDALWVDDGQGR
jgi:acetate---CoA ligase (ADP-forming)